MVKTYDPAQNSLIVGGKIIGGYADGSAIEVERNEDSWSLKVGVDGEACRAKSNNRSGKITIHLMQSSASNDDLSAFMLADELANKGVVPALLKEGSGRTVCGAATAWVKKPPQVQFGKEAGTTSWVIETDNLAMFIGGN